MVVNKLLGPRIAHLKQSGEPKHNQKLRMSSSLRLELAEHIYKYLCHEAQYSDLPDAAKESLTAASECIEQAYKLNTNSSDHNRLQHHHHHHQHQHQHHHQQHAQSQTDSAPRSPGMPDELLRIYSQHKEYAGGGGGGSKAVSTSGGGGNTGSGGDCASGNANTGGLNSCIVSGSNTTGAGGGGSGSGAGGSGSSNNNSFDQTHQHHSTSSTSSEKKSSKHSSSHMNSHSSSGGGGGGTSGSSSHRPHNHRHSIGLSVHQKKLKQKLIALIKKLRTDGSHSGSEEQYREAIERELMEAHGTRAIEELFEEDPDAVGDSNSNSEQDDWDNISDTSTPKPSLRPFFSSTTLDKI